MENVESIKTELEKKQKELEQMQGRLHTPKNDKCGAGHHRDSADLWIQVEELEEEIEKLKKRLK